LTDKLFINLTLLNDVLTRKFVANVKQNKIILLAVWGCARRASNKTDSCILLLTLLQCWKDVRHALF